MWSLIGFLFVNLSSNATSPLRFSVRPGDWISFCPSLLGVRSWGAPQPFCYTLVIGVFHMGPKPQRS